VDLHLKDDRKKGSREGLMEDLKKQGVDVHFKLLNQGTDYGRKYWINQPERYIEELEKSFLLDYNMIHVIHELVQHDETVPFKDLHSKLKDYENITQGDFALALSNIGFSIKSQKFVIEGKENEDPITEYTFIYQPDDLPVPIILKTLLATIKGLPADYSYEVIVEDIQFLPVPTPRKFAAGSDNVEEIVLHIAETMAPRSRSNSIAKPVKDEIINTLTLTLEKNSD